MGLWSPPRLEAERGWSTVEIYMWWLDLDVEHKEWLREHLRSKELPQPVRQGIAEAGGPQTETPDGGLTEADWDFIETQSEFVD